MTHMNRILLIVIIACVNALVASAKYTETMEPQGARVDLKKDYGVGGKGATTDSDALQKAIDDLSAKGGGVLFIPEGVYLIGGVRLKSNVHIVVDEKTVLKCDMTKRRGLGTTLFSFGRSGEQIRDVSLRSNGGRVRVELASSEEFPKAIFVVCYGVHSEGANFAVKIGRGYVGPRHKDNPDLKPGYFAKGSWIRNVHAAFGTNAQLHTKDLVFMPKERLGMVHPEVLANDNGFVRLGPSITAVLKDADYVEVEQVTYEGFGDCIKPIISGADIVNEKPYTLFK